MDFYVDLAVSVLLRLVKDRRSVGKYYKALAKVHLVLEELYTHDKLFADVVDQKVKEG